MSLKIGIIGLPNVGKSTLFNAITKASAEVSNYPFTTIDPNIGIVNVPDRRLEEIARIMRSPKKVPATIEFVDIAGLVKGANKGEGLGNKFLSHIREVDAIVHMVRCFENEKIAHVEGQPDPIRDIEIINSELLLADIETIEKKIGDREGGIKSRDKTAVYEAEVFKRAKDAADKGILLSAAGFDHDEARLIRSAGLLTTKPQIIAANIDELEIGREKDPLIKSAEEYCGKEGIKLVKISARIESEISELPAEEAAELLKEMKIEALSLPLLIRAGYEALGLITFFTSNEKEARAWEIKSGTPLQKAAGKVHTDMEKGFISADVINFNELSGIGDYQKAKEGGKVRMEGKNYNVMDGDLIYIKFNR